MNIENPFDNSEQKVEHKLYKFTFLHHVEAKIEFAPESVSPKEYWKSISVFLSSFFPSAGIPKIEPDLIGSIKLTSTNKQIEYVFSDGIVKVMIAHDSYKSFSESLEPALNVLISYIKDVVSLDNTKKFEIRKVNYWPVQIHKGNDDYRDILSYIFDKDIAKGFVPKENLKVEDGQTFKLTRETESSLGEGSKLEGRISLDYQVPNRYDIWLTCSTSSENVKLEDIINVARDLNSVQFDFYHNTVSDDVIEIMEKGGQ